MRKITCICDNCGKDLERNNYSLTEERLEGHLTIQLDYDFCNLKCLLRFVLDELKKEYRENQSDPQNGEQGQ